MIEIRHEKLNIEKPYRCIVVSDIHSHLDRFKQLLKEARYTTQDYLIIDGDFVEKGTQAIETVHYLQYLQQKSQRVYVLLGNCEYALDALINDDDLCQEMLHYLRKIGKSGMIDQIVSRKHLDLKKEKPQILQKIVRESLQEELNYIASLPTSIETDDFLCIHAGIENKNDWQNAPLSSFIEKRDFQKVGHCLKKICHSRSFTNVKFLSRSN